MNKKLSELPADEHYLHRFASMKFSGSADNKEKKEEDDWEIESVDSAEFDAILGKWFLDQSFIVVLSRHSLQGFGVFTAFLERRWCVHGVP